MWWCWCGVVVLMWCGVEVRCGGAVVVRCGGADVVRCGPSKQSVPFSRHLLSFWLRICVCRQSGTHTTSFSFRLGDLVTF